MTDRSRVSQDERTIATTCTMDCPDSCALEVTVRDGRIQRIAGAADDPLTRGFICTKVARFHRRVYHNDRILHPLRRTGKKGEGRFERISWETAIAEIADRFREVRERFGGESILPFHYGGSNGLLGDDNLDDVFFARLGASRLAKTFCAAPSSAVAAGMYGKMPGVAFEDYSEARGILLWGANPKASNIHLVPFLLRAREQGAFIAVIDPRKNFTEREVDLHLAVRPGTDLPVALALIHRWIEMDALDHEFLRNHARNLDDLLAAAEDWPPERAAREAGVEAKDIIVLADRFAQASPAVVRCGWGVERNRNGGRAVAAILALPALTGKFGVRGGGYTLSNSAAANLDLKSLYGDLRWNTRTVNMSQLGQALADAAPPVMALFVYNANPAATAPAQKKVLQGLAREDLFTVVHEQVMTDTALYADIVLPAVTFLEQYEIKKAYGRYAVGGVRPAIDPIGEALPNETVFLRLGRAMGFTDGPFAWSEEEYFERTARALRMGEHAGDPAKFRRGGAMRYDFPGERPIQFETVFPRTPDGKIDLCPAVLGEPPFAYQPVDQNQNGYPLQLISPATAKMISSTMGEFNFDELYVELHPEDAARRGIRTGDRVRVWNELGEVVCTARVNGLVRPGVAVIPKGAWRKSSGNGFTANALCPDHVNAVGGGACYNDARVEVEKHEPVSG